MNQMIKRDHSIASSSSFNNFYHTHSLSHNTQLDQVTLMRQALQFTKVPLGSEQPGCQNFVRRNTLS